MHPHPIAKSLRDQSTPVDPIVPVRTFCRSLLLFLLTFILAACGGSGDKVAEADAAAVRADGKEVFAPAWSANAAPPPTPGEIREIGSVLDGLPAGTLGIPSTKKPPPPKAGPIDKSASNWTIALGVFRGDTHFEDAGKALVRVKREGGLPDAFLQRRGPSTLIAYGRYTGPNDAEAQADLARIQGIQVNGAPAFSGAYLCPPYQGQLTAQLGEYDLRRAKTALGAKALYTLQIGWYGREDLPKASEADLKDARKAAEEAAQNLRREGELAFFFHGPNRSMVTVGVFDSTDFDPVQQPGIESARLRDLRKRHPLNLYNGAGYSYKAPGMREAKLVPSSLVMIPTR